MDDSIPAEQLGKMIAGAGVAQLVSVAARLGIPDLLADGPRTGVQLAETLGAHRPTLRRMLRALVSIEVLADRGEGWFGQTPVGELMRSGVPGSMRGGGIMRGEEWSSARGERWTTA